MKITTFLILSLLLYVACALFLTIAVWNNHWRKNDDCTVRDIFFTTVDGTCPVEITLKEICRMRYIPMANLVVVLAYLIGYVFVFIEDCAFKFKKSNNK